MESVFLSYTYEPHQDFERETRDLVHKVRIVVETIGLRVTTGEDLGGTEISQGIKDRIAASDALIALETPRQKLESGQYIPSDWVRKEFDWADQNEKPLVAVVHEKVATAAPYNGYERITYSTADPTAAILKIMRTIALWKKEHGRSYQIEIRPVGLGSRFDDAEQNHRCEYRTMTNDAPRGWRVARVWYEPGGAFAYLRGVPEGAKVQVRVKLDHETWQSPFTSLFGRVTLNKVKVK